MDWKNVLASPMPSGKKIIVKDGATGNEWKGTYDEYKESEFFRGNLQNSDKVFCLLPITRITEWKEIE